MTRIMFRSILPALGLGLLWVSVCLAQQRQPAAEVVTVGGQTLIRVDFAIGRTALGNEAVADFRVLSSRREVLVMGRAPGQTTLTLWDQDDILQREITLRVRPSSGTAKQIIDELKQLIGGIEGLDYREVGGTVWLEGEVLTERDMDRIDRVLASYPEVRSLVELSPMTQVLMDRAGADSVKTVQLDVTIVEVDKNMVRDLGVRWSSEVSPNSSMPFALDEGGGGIGGVFGPITGVINNLLPSIEMLTGNGQARVLARPTLITRSGQKAELFVGGELPIPVAQGGGAVSIEYKEYGVKIEFEPNVDTQDNVDMTIFVEMSNLGGPSVGGSPGFITNRVVSNVFVPQGQSITLGGLVKSDDAKNVDKVPGLGSIPILGHLFKSKRYMRNQTEMVIFATPTIVSADEAGRELREHVTAGFEEFEEIDSHKANKQKP
jgi:pilus assembly protein CpaC